MTDNWLKQELAAERAAQATAAISDQPGYERAQSSTLEELAMGDKSHREIAGMVRMLMRTDLQHEAVCLAARDRIAWLAARVEQLEAALTPSTETKATYMGEFSVPLPDLDEDGNEYTRHINVPWVTVKEIMAHIRQYAALGVKGKENG